MVGRVVHDVFAHEFHEGSEFSEFLQEVKTRPFQSLITEELHHANPYLDAWATLLAPYSADAARLTEAFELAPDLSGVLYCSRNHVVSEALFDRANAAKAHLTDRTVASEVIQRLPAARDLTFSFPRTYVFDGFTNSWGFIRVERRRELDHSGCGVAFSVTTLDPEILSLLRSTGFVDIADLYNAVWERSIHDYIHHIALYTDPSFAIGRRSPMSLANVSDRIVNWGTAMADSFNYEYWAHRTHRLITARTENPCIDRSVSAAATRYFATVAQFLETLAEDSDRAYCRRVANYLVSIYLWPLHVNYHPFDPRLDFLHEALEPFSLWCGGDPPYLSALVDNVNESVPRRALDASRTANRFERENFRKSADPSVYDSFRMATAAVTDRGFYEHWFHDAPVTYAGTATHPLLIMSHFLETFWDAMTQFEQVKKKLGQYHLGGCQP